MILILLALFLWFLFFIWISYGLDKRPVDVEQNEIEQTVSVLVAVRNEQQNIAQLLKSLNGSIGLEQNLNVILVDDSSSDETVRTAKEAASEMSRLEMTVLEPSVQGKKHALKVGLEQVSSEWIYLTDADCEVGPTTIQRMIATCQSSGSKAVFGPVLIKGNTLFAGIERHEHLNNQVVSQSLFSRGIPVMVNGANMLLHHSVLDLFGESLKNENVSGDDVFFATALPAEDRAQCYSKDAAVITKANPSWSSHWNQRLRWLSKQQKQGTRAAMFSATLFCLSVLHLYTLGWMFLQEMWIWSILYLGIRFLVELSHHTIWFARLNERVDLRHAILLSLIYPIYVLVMASASLVKPTFIWKGRTQRV
ncbi:MAG: glycosyltransferase [Flavobacteriales bacterium]|jgi:poly-beta-1,6-N-acetyl-D-glucosamine synthase|nr:glycosyltransferase [Flavobacteriales bacterium]MBT3962897.1 glycosyltransferase [Flavobacteriales bacterium]MBT4705289.1 glycosyltransferase [Flavobacteriales bacterium]MBT4930885.1 glycosyltransferase [Flavobacteriales bacterium]MBT5132777.1 glycosyltransferase [Flavobacteriales bacterium]